MSLHPAIAPMIMSLIAEHCPNVKWNFNKRMVKTPGRCSIRRIAGVYTVLKLDFSYRFFVNNSHNLELLRGIVLHEIAHALTPGARHGWEWSRKCRQIGGIAYTKIPMHMLKGSKEAHISEIIPAHMMNG